MKKIYLILFLISITSIVFAQEAQWRGPNRNGHYPETDLLKEWPENGPEMILKVEGVGAGYSSPVLHDGTIYITGKKEDFDFLSAIDLKGNILYQVKYGKAWSNTYPDTRSTPTLDNDRLYVISGSGQVVCLSTKDGSTLWSVDANDKYHGEAHKWGIAESPLIVDDKVLYTTGGDESSVVAFNKMTGEEIWRAKSLGGARAYVSPVLYQSNEQLLIIAATANHVLGIEPSDGKIIWSYYYHPPDDEEPSGGATISPNSPLVKGNGIFISKGYDQYGVMLKVSSDGQSIEEKWRTSVMDTHHGHYVVIGDYLYGSNWISNSKGNWVCLNWDTGEVMYEEKWITKGPIVLADEMLYCYEERSGNVALVNPTPKKFDMVSTFKIEYGSGPHWAHPYIKNGKLLIRHGDVLMVFNIKKIVESK